jgi:hypothetical protein
MLRARGRADYKFGGVKRKCWPLGVSSKKIQLPISLSHDRSLSQVLVAWDPACRRVQGGNEFSFPPSSDLVNFFFKKKKHWSTSDLVYN